MSTPLQAIGVTIAQPSALSTIEAAELRLILEGIDRRRVHRPQFAGPHPCETGDGRAGGMWGARRTSAGDVGAALELLTVAGRHRAGELAVWTAAAPIERALVARAWDRTGGLGTSATEQLCADLLDLELIVERPAGLAPSGHVAAVRMRATLSDELARVAAAALVELARGSLPPEARGAAPAWWQLPAEPASLWASVPALLHASGRHEELAELLADLRWTVAKVRILKYWVNAAVTRRGWGTCDMSAAEGDRWRSASWTPTARGLGTRRSSTFREPHRAAILAWEAAW